MNVYVIVNSSAGLLPEDRAGDVIDSFARHSHVTCTVDEPSHGSEIAESVRRAVESGVDVVVAAGGDGTVSTVADMLAGTEVALGIVPSGTLNHLAKDLGIPLDLDGAVDTVCRGKTTRMDLGKVNDRHFVNNVSLGAYAKALQLRDRWRAFVGKWPAMVAATITVVIRLPFFRVHLEWDGRKARRYIPLFFVGNNPYQEQWPETGTRPIINNGRLWIMMIKQTGIIRNVITALKSMTGQSYGKDELEIVMSESITVRSARRRLTIACDGETFREHTPLVFRSVPAALKVRVPGDESAGEELSE